jgi:hypothetical protein
VHINTPFSLPLIIIIIAMSSERILNCIIGTASRTNANAFASIPIGRRAVGQPLLNLRPKGRAMACSQQRKLTDLLQQLHSVMDRHHLSAAYVPLFDQQHQQQHPKDDGVVVVSAANGAVFSREDICRDIFRYAEEAVVRDSAMAVALSIALWCLLHDHHRLLVEVAGYCGVIPTRLQKLVRNIGQRKCCITFGDRVCPIPVWFRRWDQRRQLSYAEVAKRITAMEDSSLSIAGRLSQALVSQRTSNNNNNNKMSCMFFFYSYYSRAWFSMPSTMAYEKITRDSMSTWRSR